jgi:phage terminase Nu1 subunit (DNA packaging protein)
MLDDGELVTRDRAARELGCAPRTVNVAIEDSDLKPAGTGSGGRDLYRFGDLKAAVTARLEATADQVRNGQGSATAGLTAARQRLVEHKAELAEMEAQKRRGELIEAEEVRHWVISNIMVIRTKLLAFPTKLAARLGMATNLTERHAMLKAEIDALLDDLARSGDEVLARHEAAMTGKGLPT